jgi:hypothetical protein
MGLRRGASASAQVLIRKAASIRRAIGLATVPSLTYGPIRFLELVISAHANFARGALIINKVPLIGIRGTILVNKAIAFLIRFDIRFHVSLRLLADLIAARLQFTPGRVLKADHKPKLEQVGQFRAQVLRELVDLDHDRSLRDTLDNKGSELKAGKSIRELRKD